MCDLTGTLGATSDMWVNPAKGQDLDRQEFCGRNQWVSSQCCVHLVKWNSMVVNQNTIKYIQNAKKEATKGTSLQEKTTVYRLYCKSYIGTLEGCSFLTIYPSPVEKWTQWTNRWNLTSLIHTKSVVKVDHLQLQTCKWNQGSLEEMKESTCCKCMCVGVITRIQETKGNTKQQQGSLFLFFLSVFLFFLMFSFYAFSLSLQGCLHDAGTLIVIQNDSNDCLSGLRTTAFPQDSYNGSMKAYSFEPEKRLPPNKTEKTILQKKTTHKFYSGPWFFEAQKTHLKKSSLKRHENWNLRCRK